MSEHFPASTFQLPPSPGFGRMWIEPLPPTIAHFLGLNSCIIPSLCSSVTEVWDRTSWTNGGVSNRTLNLDGDSLHQTAEHPLGKHGRGAPVGWESRSRVSDPHCMQGGRLPHTEDCCFTVPQVGPQQTFLVSWVYAALCGWESLASDVVYEVPLVFSHTGVQKVLG